MKTKKQTLKRVIMNRYILMTFIACMSYITAEAQMIDLDNTSVKTATNYTSWLVANSSTSASTTVNGVTIKMSIVSDTMYINNNWYKNGIATDALINDGVHAYSKSGKNYGYCKDAATITLSITGLSVGTHTLQAYHNYLDGSGLTLPTLSVAVGGVTQQTGIVQSQRAVDKASAAKSFVTFTVTSSSTPVVIAYSSNPVSGTKYATTSFYINSLEFDVASDDDLAQSPHPANFDYHAATSNGSIKLSWLASANAPTQHKLYIGTDSTAVLGATTPTATQTTTSYTWTGLTPLQKYFWRVDEVINGTTYAGKVWSFIPGRDAFPGAEGYGRYAIGGRGPGAPSGTVYHVTSLDDDATSPAAGTFRYGIKNVTGPRTIVFDIGGVITLKSRLTCSDPYVTIAGQTAPGNGIMLRSRPFGMATDGITRFMRMRLGYSAVAGDDGLDGMGMAGNDNAIMDHCSVGWTIDEAFSSRNCKRITLQHTLISEALNVANHPNYPAGTAHGYAATIGGDTASYHHNLLAHCEGRNWSMSGGLDGNGAYAGHHDMFNNVVYNWGGRACDGGTHEGNFVNNYYKKGPATTQTFLLKADLEGTGTGSQSYYVNGNIRENTDGTQTADALDDTYKYTTSNSQVVNWTVFQSSPFFASKATIETAAAAFKNVLSDVGCNEPALDNHDTRMVTETKNGTYSATGSYNSAKGLIDKETDTGCEDFSGLNITTATRASDWDTDQDGIPDWFETAKGWSTTTANNNAVTTGQYYTNLEEYLNWLADPHFDMVQNTATAITLATYFAGYTSPTYTITNSNSSVATSLTDGTLTVTPSATGLFSFTITAAESGISLTRTFNLYVQAATGETVTNEITKGSTATTYELSQTTHTADDGTTGHSYTFGSEITITNTNSTGKPYSSSKGTNPTIKYSNGELYTINLPSGISINSIKLSGYNNGSSDLYPFVNDMSYSSDVFPAKNGTTTTTKEYTIDFASAVTTAITFKASGAQACWTITLSTTSGVNTAILKETATEYTPEALSDVNVTLWRTLSNSYWNTFCVPFDISANLIKSVFGGATITEFTGVSGTTMNFTEAKSITAGKPYLIKPTNTVEKPVFSGVSIQAQEPMTITNSNYSYIGTYIKYAMETGGTQLFLDTKGNLAQPSAAPKNVLKGLRAYFIVPSSGGSAKVNILGELTDIDNIDQERQVSNGSVYNLNGQLVSNNGENLKKGIYIIGGKKKIIK